MKTTRPARLTRTSWIRPIALRLLRPAPAALCAGAGRRSTGAVPRGPGQVWGVRSIPSGWQCRPCLGVATRPSLRLEGLWRGVQRPPARGARQRRQNGRHALNSPPLVEKAVHTAAPGSPGAHTGGGEPDEGAARRYACAYPGINPRPGLVLTGGAKPEQGDTNHGQPKARNQGQSRGAPGPPAAGLWWLATRSGQAPCGGAGLWLGRARPRQRRSR